MQRATAWTLCVVFLAPAPMRMSAQTPTVGPKSGNPTPGTEQPQPPNLADRITVTGCVRLAAGAPAALANAQTTPTDSRFVLTDVKRGERVPVGTGTSTAAAAPAAPTYRLDALESQLSAFVGARVEISGAVKDVEATANNRPPALVVEFVQKIAAKCP